jgi:hypothetical protein
MANDVRRKSRFNQLGSIRTLALLIATLVASPTLANPLWRGVDVQVNEGKPIPSVAQLTALLNPNDIVRDVLGWQKVDPRCDLTRSPGDFTLPGAMQQLYRNVQQAGGRNFVTLAFNNKHCGQKIAAPAKAFPDTDALRAEFAAYAAAVVRNVPNLAGVSIWNEMNGMFNGGYATPQQAMAAYCRLSNVVVRAIRRVDPRLPIAIGATGGSNLDTWFIPLFDQYGCVGKADSTIWLDVHPYLGGVVDPLTGLVDWDLWNQNLTKVRADGITNPLIATEWGDSAAAKWLAQHPNGNYMSMFDVMVTARDNNWAALAWYEAIYDHAVPRSGLFSQDGISLSPLGAQYVSAYKH